MRFFLSDTLTQFFNTESFADLLRTSLTLATYQLRECDVWNFETVCMFVFVHG